MVTSQRKAISPSFPRNHELLTVPRAGKRPQNSSVIDSWRVLSCEDNHSLSEFLTVAAMTHTEGSISQHSFLSSHPLCSFHVLFLGISWALEKGAWNKILLRKKHWTVPYAHNSNPLQVFSLTSVQCEQHLLSRLRAALSMDISIKKAVWQNSYSWLLPVTFSAIGFRMGFYSSKCSLLPVKEASDITRKCLVKPITGTLLMHLWARIAWNVAIIVAPAKWSKFIADCSPPAT